MRLRLPSPIGPLTQYALLAGPLLSMLDSSIVNVAVEPMARALHASLTTMQWTVSGYLLALGAGLAATAYLARRFGTLPVYRASLIAFTIASAMCAVAPDAAFLIGTRILQGLVAALLVPLAMSMLLGRRDDPRPRGGSAQPGSAARDISVLAGIALFVGPAVGPTVGGALIGLSGWRSIFLINVPLGALAAVAVRTVPPSLAPGRQPGTRFDLPGLVLLATGLTALLLGTARIAAAGWAAATTWTPLAVGAVLLAAYAWWAARREQPALDLSLARQRVPLLSMLLCALASVVTWAAVFLLPVFVQSVQGRSALAAGLAMAPQGLITGLSTALGPRLLARFTVRMTVLSGFAVLAAASLGLLAIGVATPLWVVALILACRSASTGLVINPLLQAFTRHLCPDQLADGSTLFNTWQRVAGSFGIGLIAALYSTAARTHGPVHALHQAALVIVAISAAGALTALALPVWRAQFDLERTLTPTLVSVTTWSISEAAAKTGLSQHTLRWYERIGLLDVISRTADGRRRYNDRDLELLSVFTKLRDTGMPVKEMLRYAGLLRSGAGQAERLELLKRHRIEVRRQMAAQRECLKLLDNKIDIYTRQLQQEQ